MSSALRAARPRLSVVAPLTSYLCWGYAVINLLLGLGMFFLYRTSINLAIVDLLSYQGWGVVFFLTGVFGVYSLISNRWEWVQLSLLLGLLVKAIWMIALIIRCFTAPATILITLVWVALAYFQAGAYIYFAPGGRRA